VKDWRHTWPRDQAGREGVDHRDSDAVEPAGDLVAATAELAAGVEHGQRQGQGGKLLPGGGVGGDAAPVVLDPHPAVLEQREDDPVAVSGQRLVDRVVDDLPDQVVEPALAGRADVHARTLADGLEPLEDLDRRGVVGDRVIGDVGEGEGGGLLVALDGRFVGHTHLFALGRLGWSPAASTYSRSRLERSRPGAHDTPHRPGIHGCTPSMGGSVDEICRSHARNRVSQRRAGGGTGPGTGAGPSVTPGRPLGRRGRGQP
jgi:hypothetical protein